MKPYFIETYSIILLSCVRSNAQENIGFLAIENRVCVALSRAKHALFCIGNFALLQRNSTKWADILASVVQGKYLAGGLQLTCGTHPENDTIARTSVEFITRPEGGCSVPCDFRLSCGHVCKLICHNYDRYVFVF